MSERIDRLMNIHIEDYAQNEKELPVYAMLRLYLNCAENPVEVIDKAQSGGEELVTVLMKATENMVYEISEFKGKFGPMKIFLGNLNFKKIAAENGEQISRFMEDCRREI